MIDHAPIWLIDTNHLVFYAQLAFWFRFVAFSSTKKATPKAQERSSTEEINCPALSLNSPGENECHTFFLLILPNVANRGLFVLAIFEKVT